MAAEAYLRFYEELNDYLPAQKRKREFAFAIGGKTNIRSMLEKLGVPLAEVEFVLVNGISAELSVVLSPGDRVSIYPVFESFDVTPLLRFRVKPLRRTRFTVDAGLRALAVYLRSLGFDVAVKRPLVNSETERRIVLTTDQALLKSGLSRVCVVRKTTPSEQLKEVLSRLHLNRCRGGPRLGRR